MATRIRCSSSGFSPSRVPGSCAISTPTCRASIARTCSSGGAHRGGTPGFTGKNPSAWKTFSPPIAGPRSRLDQRPLETGQPVRTAGKGLDLELDEALANAASVQHRNGVEGHVGDGALTLARAYAFPPCAENRRRRERPSAEHTDEQRRQLARRLMWPARDFELEPLALAGQLQLPEALPVLDPPPQRDARPSEGAVGRVVIRGRERLGLEHVTGKIRQREARWNR